MAERLGLEGVVFDLDATLVNLGEFVDWRTAHRSVLETYLSSGCDEEKVKLCTNEGLFRTLEFMGEELRGALHEDEARSVQGRVYEVLEAWELEGVSSCCVMPGCLESLEWLEERGVKMGVCTANSPMVAREVLRLQGIGDYFAAVVGRTPELRLKPHPDQVLACFRMMGVDPHRGVVVGDSPKDILAGKGAGARTVAIPVYFTRLEALEDAGPDIVLPSMAGLPEALSALKF